MVPQAVEQFSRLGRISDIPREQTDSARFDLVEHYFCRRIQLRPGDADKKELADPFGERHGRMA
jgi:hypothetical protein